MTPDIADLPQRFRQKIQIAPTGCWVWTAAKDAAGYGRVNWGGHAKVASAHRTVYRLLIGEPPEGAELDHLCRNRACVNPEHLDPVSRVVNARRGIGGLVAQQRYAQHLWCPQGHPLFGDNLYAHRTRAGYVNKQCRLCRAASNHRRRASNKETS